MGTATILGVCDRAYVMCRSVSLSVAQCRSVSLSVAQCRSVSLSVAQCRSVSLRVAQCRSGSLSVAQCRSVLLSVHCRISAVDVKDATHSVVVFVYRTHRGVSYVVCV